MLTWFMKEQSQVTPLSGPIMRHQAEKFHHQPHGAECEGDFIVSKGWFQYFQKRHSIGSVKIQGEMSANTAAYSFPAQLKEFLEKTLTKEQIYNADETGLFYKMLPDRTLAVKDDIHKTEGIKQAKNREAAAPPPVPAKRHTDAVEHLHWLIEYVEEQQNEELITTLHLRKLFRRTQLRARKSRVQKLIDIFIKHRVDGHFININVFFFLFIYITIVLIA